MIVTDDMVVYLTKSGNEGDTTSVLIKFDTTDNRVTAYSKTNVWYGGLSRGTIGGFYYLGAGDRIAKGLIVIKATTLALLSTVEEEASGYTAASTSDFSDN